MNIEFPTAQNLKDIRVSFSSFSSNVKFFISLNCVSVSVNMLLYFSEPSGSRVSLT